MGKDAMSAGEKYAQLRMAEILDALQKVLESTAYPAVTVTSICAVAGISRPTFYHYFKDKDDIVQWFWDQAGEVYLEETGRVFSWYESNLSMLRYFLQHKRFMEAVLPFDEGINSCINHGCRQRAEFLRTLIREESPLEFNDDIDFEIRFFSDAESRAITSWVKRGMPEHPEVLARRLEGCVPPALARIVNDILRKHEGACVDQGENS